MECLDFPLDTFIVKSDGLMLILLRKVGEQMEVPRNEYGVASFTSSIMVLAMRSAACLCRDVVILEVKGR